MHRTPLLGELVGMLGKLYLALDDFLQFFWLGQFCVVVCYSNAGLVHLEVLDLYIRDGIGWSKGW